MMFCCLCTRKQRPSLSATSVPTVGHIQTSSTRNADHECDSKKYQRKGALLTEPENQLRDVPSSASAVRADENTEAVLSMHEKPWTLPAQAVRRFQRSRESTDLEHAISALEASISSTSASDHRHVGGIVNLGLLRAVRFVRLGELSDLEEAISRHKDAVELTPDDHPSKASRLNHLGKALLARFERLRDRADLDQAISKYRDIVDLMPDGDPDKPHRLNILGVNLFSRFELIGELGDLQEAISRHSNAIDLMPDGHAAQPVLLNNLGNCFKARFDRLGDQSDLEQGVLMHMRAVNLTPSDHSDKAARLSNLGNSLKARFELHGDLSDLEEAISRYRDAVDLTPRGHHRAACLNNLGNSLKSRFERLGEQKDLDEAISRQKDAVALTAEGHPDKSHRLNNIGNSLFARFKSLGEQSDLDNAISMHRAAVDIQHDGAPSKIFLLNSLGNSLHTRFQHVGELSDLDEAVSRYRNAVDLTPHDHPYRSHHLSSLGNSLTTRFQRLGELSDLKEAISRHKEAVDLISDGHPKKVHLLNNLGDGFYAHFKRLGDVHDIEEAISSYQSALALMPHGCPDKAILLSNLGRTFLTRFDCLGELRDLEEAVSQSRKAVDLTPASHPGKSTRLGKLGNGLVTRFQYYRQPNDVEDAISRLKYAADLIPDDHPNKAYHLNDLATSFEIRFRHLGGLDDLEEAVLKYRNAVALIPDDHLVKAAFLNNLSRCLYGRFALLGELSDLEEALSTGRDAVDRTPDGHPEKPGRLGNLGNSFKTRFERLAALNDLEDAISRHGDAVDLTQDEDPIKPLRLKTFADTLITRFNSLHDTGDFERALSLYSRSACLSIGPANIRFHASQKWIVCARAIRYHTLLQAYSIATGLLPQLAWGGLSLAHRYQELVGGADVVREAAAEALNAGFLETAVEWLEQGRSIVWSELFQLRSSYEELSAVHPDHARRLQELSAALHRASAEHEKLLSPLYPLTDSDKHHKVDTHRLLAIERDNLLQEIRRFPGFERFLLHKEFSRLRAAAHSGPVVILNAAKTRCDALIVRADAKHVVHVQLHDLTLHQATSFRNILKGLLGHARVIRGDDSEREGRRARMDDFDWGFLLSLLWKHIVKPVLEALNFSTPGNLSRIFWCPTGPLAFLPIHAAGLYGAEYSQPGHKASDFVISSYIPNLSILTPSPDSGAAPGDDHIFLTVRQPPSDGLPMLPGVAIELEHIREVIRSSPLAQTTLLESSVGTIEEVLDLMKGAEWVHFACHGIQDTATPTDSGLCLADGRRLKISDIISLSRPRGGLAFLSACQTAMGDEGLSDEALHIAAGMLYAGYGGVIGTLWSISDRLAPLVARDVYEQLFNRTRPDYREAARALHEATGRLRDSGASFDDWLPFIHVGL